MAKSFDYYFAQLRKTEDHRSKKAEVEIRKLYKEVLADTKKFVAEEYYELAEDGELTYEILRSKGQAARFLSEVEQRLDGLTPKVSQEIQTAVEEMYKLSYDSMVQAVQMSQTKKELRECLEGLQGVSVDTIKAAVENPIAGLTLNDTLERNRKNIIWNIKREIGTGLTMGDRYETMAKRIAKSLDGDYKKAVTIVRTETGRAREKGHLDSAKEINDALKEGSTSMRMVKTWKTMKDGRVRDTHGSMEGVTVAMDEEFILPSGVKTMAPKQSGVASEDINCRCFVKYHLEEETKNGIKSYGTTDTSDKGINDSLAKYTDENGNLTDEREKLHREIIDEFFDGAEKPSGKPIFTVMGGGSAAGKSTMLDTGAVKLPKGTVTVDSDAIKKKLPEFDDFISEGKSDIAAAYVHEESSALAKRMLGIANREGFNVALDGTGDGSVKSLIKKIEAARKAGLRVEGVYATVPTEVALARSYARGVKTGRVVPNAVIEQTHKKVSQVLPECAHLFDDVKLFDTTDGAVLIATGGGGKPLTPVKGKEALFKAFLDKAK